jgi:hypothetical protein
LVFYRRGFVLKMFMRCLVLMAAAFLLVTGCGLLSAQSTGSGATPGSVTGTSTAGVEANSAIGQDETLQLPIESQQWESAAELDSQANVAAPVASDPGTADDDVQQESQDAARDSGDSGTPAAGFSFSGLAPMHDGETVDGLSAQQSYRSGPRGAAGGGPSLRTSYSLSAVQSFRVLTNNYSAQSGGVGGALEVTSRSATDHLHGSAFLLLRESAWAATNPFSIETHYHDGVVTSAPVKPGGSRLQLGGAAGLPLPGRWALRKHAGLFVSAELQLIDDHIVSTPALASFYALTPMQLALLANRGVSTKAIYSALDYLDSLSGTTARSAYRLLVDLRADAALSAHDHTALSYSGHRMDAPAGAALGQASDAVIARGRGSLGESSAQVDVAAGHWVHTFSPRVHNDLRAQFARDSERESPHAPLPQEPAIGPGGLAPQISIAPNGFAYGTPSNLSGFASPIEQRIELADTLQLRAGRHLLTLGADWSRVHDRIQSLNAAEGSMLYDSSNFNGHAGGLVDWITDDVLNVYAYPTAGCPEAIGSALHVFCFRSYTQGFGSAPIEFTTHEIAGFAEDALHLRPDLSLTFGARYEYTLLPPPQAPNPTLDADVAALALPSVARRPSFPKIATTSARGSQRRGLRAGDPISISSQSTRAMAYSSGARREPPFGRRSSIRRCRPRRCTSASLPSPSPTALRSPRNNSPSAIRAPLHRPRLPLWRRRPPPHSSPTAFATLRCSAQPYCWSATLDRTCKYAPATPWHWPRSCRRVWT